MKHLHLTSYNIYTYTIALLFPCIGEIQYKSRVEDIRILKLEVKRLRRERGLLSKSVSSVDELRYDASMLYHTHLYCTL